MGCGSSKVSQHPAHQDAGSTNRPIQLQQRGAQPSRGTRKPPQRSEIFLSPRARTEFLAAVDAAFGNTDYGIIGGAALAEYGNTRETNDVDVIIPHEISLTVANQLLSRGMVRTAGGGLGYAGSAPLLSVSFTCCSCP